MRAKKWRRREASRFIFVSSLLINPRQILNSLTLSLSWDISSGTSPGVWFLDILRRFGRHSLGFVEMSKLWASHRRSVKGDGPSYAAVEHHSFQVFHRNFLKHSDWTIIHGLEWQDMYLSFRIPKLALGERPIVICIALKQTSETNSNTVPSSAKTFRYRVF